MLTHRVRPWTLPADPDKREKALKRIEKLEETKQHPFHKRVRRMTGAEYKAALEKQAKNKPKKDKD